MSITEKHNINPSDRVDENKDQSVFIWIDILGFSEIVDDGKKYEELVYLLKNFQNQFCSSSNYSSLIISDGVILEISPSHHQHNYQYFMRILKDIGEKQFAFIIENEQFIRGGMAAGSKVEYKPLSSGDKHINNIISNGLARSYNLESNIICWPSISKKQ